MNNIKLDWAEYMNMSPVSRDSGLKHAAQWVRKGAITFVGWLKHEPKGGLHCTNLKC